MEETQKSQVPLLTPGFTTVETLLVKGCHVILSLDVIRLPDPVQTIHLQPGSWNSLSVIEILDHLRLCLS